MAFTLNEYGPDVPLGAVSVRVAEPMDPGAIEDSELGVNELLQPLGTLAASENGDALQPAPSSMGNCGTQKTTALRRSGKVLDCKC